MKFKLVTAAVLFTVGINAHAELFGKSEDVKNLEKGQLELRQEQSALNSEMIKVRETLTQTVGVVDNGPDWLTNPPQIENAVVVAVQGTRSTDRGRALEKAIHKGYAALSRKISNEVKTLTKNYEYETGDVTVEEYQTFTRSVSDSTLEGVQRLKTEIVRDGRYYYAMVLLAYPMGESNTLLKLRKQAEAKTEAQLRSQRAEQELDAQHKRKMDEERVKYERLKEQVGPKSEPKVESKPADRVSVDDSLAPNEAEVKETVVADYSKAPNAEAAKRAALVKSLERAQIEGSQVVELTTTVR